MMGFYISEILIGKYYRSGSRRWLDGIIVEAVKRDVMYADNAYAIRVRQQQAPYEEFWATIFIADE